ncbi:UDP-N-acetylmuramate--L-alanine ligase [Sulfurimonas sp. HSL-3221]|uniref:UDP-N-acetylmuramate--L-alanine ligase n=1 Tax=Sulfurimonadaceae TaxID=2771471 RepID=UPI001E30BE45|nr:UDP-N-acetylmuramate--L-alanine ligase [Sulfurimonas sp. HSL-3221]UFS63396.1 UDP-N-acetylmuramate--L-alanine ligase [Sulfurimonas sp. HSL-3221]
MKIHFIGIGGIGISGLAQYMDHKGNKVSGSDIAENRIVRQLKEKGVAITIPHDASAITDQDLVVHSAIIKPTNVEVAAAKAKGIEVLPRREALLRILQDKEVYAVAGAHGKSTTSAILAAIMEGSAIIGAESKAFGSNVRYNDTNDRLIFEADESDGSFLNANPYCAIVTNAEPEHMEYYEYDYDRFYDAYRRFIASAAIRVINAEDEFLSTIEGDAIRLYPSRDISEVEYVLHDGEPHTRFRLKDLGSFDVWGFGEHIALDAALAILAAVETMPVETVREKILGYRGIKKRFDIIDGGEKCVLIDDYGHHPTEIAATMASARTYARLLGLETITAVWQPHKYSRTIDNLEAFSHCFEGVDRLIILPVWAAGEEPRIIDFEGVFSAYSPLLADRVKRSGCGLEVLKEGTIVETPASGLIIGFGAGDITYQLRGEK